MSNRVNIVGKVQEKIVEAIKTTYPTWNVENVPDTGEMFVDNPNGNVGVMFTGLELTDYDAERVSPFKFLTLRYNCTLAGRDNFLTQITNFLGDLLAIGFKNKTVLILSDDVTMGIEFEISSITFNTVEDGVWIYDCSLLAKMLVNQRILSIRQLES